MQVPGGGTAHMPFLEHYAAVLGGGESLVPYTTVIHLGECRLLPCLIAWEEHEMYF